MGLKGFREKMKWLDPFTYVDLCLMPRVNPSNNTAISWAVYIASAFVFAWLIYTGIGLLLGTGSPMVIVMSGSMEPLYHRGDVIFLQHAEPAQLQVPSVELPGFATLQDAPLETYAQTYCSGPEPGLLECRHYRQMMVGGEIDETDFVVSEVRFPDARVEVNKQGPIVVYFSTILHKPIIHRVVAKLKAQDGWYVLTKGDSPHNPLLDQDAGIAAGAVNVEKLDGKAIASIPAAGCVKLWVFDNLGSLITRGKLPEDFAGIC